MKKLLFILFLILLQFTVASADFDGPINETTLSVGNYHVVGILEDGTAIAVGEKEDGKCEVSDWNHLVSVSAGAAHTLGLRDDGTVVAVGDNGEGACNVSEWTDIVMVSAGYQHSVGLKKDGTVVAVGSNESGQLNVSAWKDIKYISAGAWFTLGVKTDGTVVAVGYNDYGQCNTEKWENIVAVAGGTWASIGLTADGKVVYCGGRDSHKNLLNKTKAWRDIVQISIEQANVIAVTKDGKVESTLSLDFGEGSFVMAGRSGWNGHLTALTSEGIVVSNNSEIDGTKLRLPSIRKQVENDKGSADNGIWHIEAYVDEFDLPTEETYVVSSQLTGKFSNSTTNNSEVTAYVYCMKEAVTGYGVYEVISIRLFEYGNYRVQNIFSESKAYDIVVMDNAGSKYYLSGSMLSKGSEIMIGGDDAQVIIGALQRGGTVRFAITDNSVLTKYILTIENADGFDVVYDQWWTE